MEKVTAYEIDGTLYSERDALKKLGEDYGNNVLTLSKILVQNADKYGKMMGAIESQNALMAKIVKANERLQEFKKMVRQ